MGPPSSTPTAMMPASTPVPASGSVQTPTIPPTPRRHPHQAVLFERARQLTRWHYQWLVVHDWLKTVTLSGIADKILFGGPKHYAPRHHELFMPLEFSVAGFRFGHTLVRNAYDHNR